MAQRIAVEAPEFAPVNRTAGLLSYTENIHENIRPSGVSYLSTSVCGPVGYAPGLCSPQAAVPVDTEKTETEWLGHINGDPFAVYRMVGCYLDGSDDYKDIATRSLAATEGFAVEAAVYSLILTAEPEQIGTGTVVQVVAALEQWAAGHIPAQHYLHVTNLGLNAMASKGLVIRQPDGTLQTLVGSKIVVGSGYEADDVDAATFEAFISGPIHLWRGDYIVTSAVNLPSNHQSALAERVYTATTECAPARGVASVPDIQEP